MRLRELVRGVDQRGHGGGKHRVKPKKGHPREVILTSSRDFKLDRTPDGWEIKALHKRAVAPSGDFLLKRGWKFDALAPFMTQTP